MKHARNIVLAAALAFATAAFGQGATPGTSPLSIPKGGTSASTAAAARAALGVTIGTEVQAWDADLSCLAANSTAGMLTYTGAGTCAARTLTAPAAGFTITNPAGTAGNPIFVLANDLAAVEALASTGFAVRIATDSWAQRSIAGTTNEVCVTNGDGVAGNPTLGICAGFLSTAHSWSGVQTFTSPIVGTQPPGDNSTKAASTAFVTNAVAESTTGVASINGQTGVVGVPVGAGGRLTLTSGTPTTTTDVTAAPWIYYAPLDHRFVPIYNGSDVRQYDFTSSLTDAVGLTVTLGSSWTANTNFDWYVTLNGGVPTLCSVAWTDDITPAIARSSAGGMQTNSTAITSSCRINNTTNITVAANQGTYLGMSRTVAAGQMEDSAAKRYLWNAYNQKERNLANVPETTANWDYTNTDKRQARGTATNQIDFVTGLGGSMLDVSVDASCSTTAGASFCAVGIGINSTSVDSSQIRQTTTSTNRQPVYAKWRGYPSIGRQVYVWLEFTQAVSGTNTYSSGGAAYQSGITGKMLM